LALNWQEHHLQAVQIPTPDFSEALWNGNPDRRKVLIGQRNFPFQFCILWFCNLLPPASACGTDQQRLHKDIAWYRSVK